MDHSDSRQPTAIGGGTSIQMGHTNSPYQSAPMMATGSPAVAVSSPTHTSIPTSQHQLTYPQAHHFHSQQPQQLQAFWTSQMQEIEQVTEFRNHNLPLARIKKIMKSDEDVRMISAEAPVIFSKACEMFILELTLRSWLNTEENKRRTLQKNDIAAAISRTDVFDFLLDIVPRDELKEEGLGVTKAAMPLAGPPADSVPFYYLPSQLPVGPSGMIMGKPVDQAALYAAGQQLRPPASFVPWLQPQPQPQLHAQPPESEEHQNDT